MGHPHWTPDQYMLSNCCGALSAGEIVDGDAICSKCGEHATFEREEIEVPDFLTFDGAMKTLFPGYNPAKKSFSILEEKP